MGSWSLAGAVARVSLGGVGEEHVRPQLGPAPPSISVLEISNNVLRHTLILPSAQSTTPFVSLLDCIARPPPMASFARPPQFR